MSVFRITALAAVVLLAGCNSGERAKVVKLDKGVYQGAADSQLSDATRVALAQRAQQQRFGADLNQALRPASAPDAQAVTIEGRISGQKF